MVYMFIFAKVFSLDISLISACSANPPHLVCLFTLVHITLPLALFNNKFQTDWHLIAKLLQTKPLGSNQNFRSTGVTGDLGNKI